MGIMKTTMLTGLLCLAMGCAVGVLPEDGSSENVDPPADAIRPVEAAPLDTGVSLPNDTPVEAATYPRAGWHRLTLSLPMAPLEPITFLALVERDGDVAWGEVQGLTVGPQVKPLGRMVGMVDFAPLSVHEDFMVLPRWGFDGDIVLPDVANPWPTHGAIHIADLVLRPYEVRPVLCGDVEGQLVHPWAMDLEGSTFTLAPLRGPHTLSTPPPINCAGDLATPADVH